MIITVETAICVALPVYFRTINKARYTCTAISACLVWGALLQVTIPIIRHAELRRYNQTIYQGSCIVPVSYGMALRNGPFFEAYERAYFWTHAMTVIVLPIVLMFVCSFVVALKFREKNLGQAFSEGRKCVIRLTFATTLAHLVLEGPGLITVILAAIYGSSAQSQKEAIKTCLIPVITNFLASFNAAIPFFLYLLCNKEFRKLALGLVRRGDTNYNNISQRSYVAGETSKTARLCIYSTASLAPIRASSMSSPVNANQLCEETPLVGQSSLSSPRFLQVPGSSCNSIAKCPENFRLQDAVADEFL